MADSSDSNDGDSAGNKKLGSNPQAGGGMDNSMPGRMTPFARMKLQQQEKEAQLYLDFCEFAAMWLQPSGCVQKHMVVLYFREHYDNHKYKYSSSAEDIEIEDAFDKWNQEEGPKAEANEFGLYLGVQINTDHEREVRIQEQLEKRKTQIKLIIAESKRTGVKPPLEILKEAMELGVIEVPKATLESMKAVSARPQRRVSIAAPQKHTTRARAPSPDSPKRKKKSSSRLGKSMGDLDLKSAERKDKKSHKDKDKKSKNKDKDKDRKSSKSSSSRLHKSMGNLDYKSSSRKSDKEDKKDKKKKEEKEHKSSSRDKDEKKSSKDKDKDHKTSKSSSSRLHKSMGNLDFKEKDRKSSSRDKDKDRKSSSKDKDKDKKSTSKGKDKEKDRKSSSKDKEKEKKSSSRKSSRRNSAH